MEKVKKEQWYQTEILRYLHKIPGCFVWKNQAGPYVHAGLPDVMCVIGGQLFAFEVKRPGGKPTELQKLTLKLLAAAGAAAAVVTEVSEVEQILHAHGVRCGNDAERAE